MPSGEELVDTCDQVRAIYERMRLDLHTTEDQGAGCDPAQLVIPQDRGEVGVGTREWLRQACGVDKEVVRTLEVGSRIGGTFGCAYRRWTALGVSELRMVGECLEKWDEHWRLHYFGVDYNVAVGEGEEPRATEIAPGVVVLNQGGERIGLLDLQEACARRNGGLAVETALQGDG